MEGSRTGRSRESLVPHGKFMSYVLRHHPDEIGLALDDEGWARIDVLVRNANARPRGARFTEDLVRDVAETCSHQRFIISADGQRVRAAHGHTVPVNLDLEAQVRPDRP